MKPLGDERRHYMLASRMAKAVGLDLPGAHATGAITSQEWSDVVTRCRGCDWAAGCNRFLNDLLEEIDTAPATCANSDVFAGLKS